MKIIRVVVLASGLLIPGMAARSEPDAPPERTFRAMCNHRSHGPIWLEGAYVSPGPALMQAHKHNAANTGHEAIILRLRGGRR